MLTVEAIDSPLHEMMHAMHCSPTVMQTSGATWLSIQSMAMQNSAGANTHPCHMPDDVPY